MRYIIKDDKQQLQQSKNGKKKFKKVWKYKPNYYCSEHNERYIMQCQKCEKKVCKNCDNTKESQEHQFKDLNTSNQDNKIYYEKEFQLKRSFCRSNIEKYINKQTGKTMLLFCSLNFLNEFDLEEKIIVREIRMLDEYYNLKVINNFQLLTWNCQKIRLFNIRNMKQIRRCQFDVQISDIVYFEKYNMYTLSGENGGIFLMNEDLKLIKKVENTGNYVYFEIDKLNERTLLCSSIGYNNRQYIYIKKLDILTGETQQLFKKSSNHRHHQRINFLLTLNDCTKNYKNTSKKILNYINKYFDNAWIAKLIDINLIIFINYYNSKMTVLSLNNLETVQVIQLPQNSMGFYFLYVDDNNIIIPANDFIVYTRKRLSQDSSEQRTINQAIQ